MHTNSRKCIGLKTYIVYCVFSGNAHFRVGGACMQGFREEMEVCNIWVYEAGGACIHGFREYIDVCNIWVYEAGGMYARFQRRHGCA